MNALTTPLCALPGIKVPIVQATIGSAATLAPAAAVCGAGGHVRGETTTMTLLPATVDAVGPVPVIAAGGIGDGRGLAAVLALGAQAGWIGTQFLTALEANTHEVYRRRLAGASETDTVLTRC